MANNCPQGVHGKHPKGLSGCGCDNDPLKRSARVTPRSARGKPEKKAPRGHRHDWSIIKTDTVKTDTEVITTITEKCLSDGCNNSPRTREDRQPRKPSGRDKGQGRVIETGTKCRCCRAPFPQSHSHRNCAKCDAEDYL